MKTISHPASSCFAQLRNTFTALVLAIGLGAWSTSAQAANFTTSVQQGTANKWSDAIWNPGPVAPTAGNTYEVILGASNPARIRNPASGSGDATIGVKTFPGDTLTLNTNTEIRAKGTGNTINFPGVNGNAGLIMNGGNIDTGDNGVFFCSGVMLVQSNSSFTCGDSGGNNTRGWSVSAQIRGSAALTVWKMFPGGVAAVDLTGTSSPFTGSWYVKSGTLKATGAGSLGDASVVVFPTNATANAAQLEVMYDVASAGTLTLTNGGKMILHQNCTFSAVTIEGTSLSPGAHSYAELSSTFPNSFATGGSGSITVQPPAPPTAPTNVSVINGDGQVTLSWTASPRAASYTIKRSSTSGGPYTAVGSTTTATTFTDTGLPNGATYYYVVSATNSLGESPNSDEVVGSPNVLVTGVTAVGGTNEVTVSWSALPNAGTYTVKRSSTSGGPYTTVGSGITETSYVDTSVQGGRTYYYIVSASIVGDGESGQSVQASATTAPSAPTLTGGLYSATAVKLAWGTTDTAVGGFLVEQADDGVNFVELAALSSTTRTYVASNLFPGNPYLFRIRATNNTGFSAYSTPVSVTTPTFGINVNYALNTAPVPSGYLVDSGLPFGDRGNGFSYGWFRNDSPVDLSADARYRQAANSPDIRYDTFVHMIKATPPAVWEIVVPNGYYQVHVVGGEPSNADEVLQYDVEGVVTPVVIPGTSAAYLNNWADFTVYTAVYDGRLTVRSGPSSQTTVNNNKICFVDIYAAVPEPPVIGEQPQGQTNEVNHPISLSVTTSSGSAPFLYQWYRNGEAVPTGTNGTLSFPHVQFTDAGDYTVVITNHAGSVTSSVATVTVLNDTTPPSIVSVGSVDGITVGILWSEEVDASSATEVFNYTFTDSNGGIVIPSNTGTLRNGNAVYFTLPTALVGSFTVNANVYDLNQNLSDARATGRVVGLTGQDVGSPALAGSNSTLDGNVIELIGGGADVWNTGDQFYFASKSVAGNFDMSVRVTKLVGADTVTKALLDARETIASNSPAIHISVNPPPPGRDQFEAGQRSTLGGATTSWGTNFVGIGIPNAWIRLTRIGDVFSSYRSSNGAEWTYAGSTTQALAASMLVGLGVTAHNNSLLATGTFSNFRLIEQVTIVTPPANQSVAAGGSATFSVVADSPGGGSISYQWYHGASVIVGATSSTFTVNNASAGDAGEYYVVVNNSISSATSSAATLTVQTTAVRPTIGNGTNGGSAPSKSADTFTFSFHSQAGVTYIVEYKDSLDAASWTFLKTVSGTDGDVVVNDTSASGPYRFYRLSIQP
jgi:fibronectin type 3 domain-containing protein